MEDDIQKFTGAKYRTVTTKQGQNEMVRVGRRGRRKTSPKLREKGRVRPKTALPTLGANTPSAAPEGSMTPPPRPEVVPDFKTTRKKRQKPIKTKPLSVWAGSLRGEDWKLRSLDPGRAISTPHGLGRLKVPNKMKLRAPYEVYRRTFRLDTPVKERYYFDKKAEQFHRRLSFTPTAPM